MSYRTSGPRQAPPQQAAQPKLPPETPPAPRCCEASCHDVTTAEDARLALSRWICPRCRRQYECPPEGEEAPADPEPCPHPAGSPGKISCMIGREDEGYALFSAADSAEQVSPPPPSSSHKGQAGAGLHDSGSPDRGVSRMRRRYRARRPRTDEYLGLYETREEARAAVRRAEQAAGPEEEG